jgi:hypothetical protein
MLYPLLNLIFLTLIIIYSNFSYSQPLLTGDISEVSQNSSNNKISVNSSLSYFSNFKTDESEDFNQSNLSLSLSHSALNGGNIFYTLGYTQDLDGYQEGDIDDFSVAFFKTIDKVIFRAVGIIPLSKDSRDINYLEGSAVLGAQYIFKAFSTSIIPGLIVQKNFHQFKTSFNGESSSDWIVSARLNFNKMLTEKIFFSLAPRITRAVTYGGTWRAPVSGLDVNFNYLINQNSSIGIGLISRIDIYNDQAQLRSVERFVSSSDSIITTNINVNF